MLRIIVFGLVVICLPVSMALAGPVQDARKAYELRDYQTTLSLVKPLANRGDGAAQELLSEMYFHGAGVDRDDNAAAKWASAAADSYRKAAVHGDAESQVRLGSMLARWITGIKHDPEEAMNWYRKADDHGNAEAPYQIALLYAWGNGVKQNSDEAFTWARKAADRGSTPAMLMLGQGYERRCCKTHPDDYAQAMMWYKRAAAQGDAEGEFQIGSMYWFGRGVKQNCSEAIKRWRSAAEAGVPNAQSSMADVYQNGECGIKQSFIESYFWHSLPGGRESDPAAAKVDISHLSPMQIEAVGKRVAEWKSKRLAAIAGMHHDRPKPEAASPP